MDSVQYELVGEAGQEVPVGTWILCGGVQQQGPGGLLGRGHLGVHRQEHLRPPLPHHQDHVDPRQQGNISGSSGHLWRLSSGLEGRGTRN